MDIVLLDDPTTLTEEAARRIANAIHQCLAEQPWCAVALSGGSTPRPVYQRLAQSPYREQIDWARVHWFWGDERAVPPDHPDSNYRMAYEAMLAHVPVPSENIHRIPAEKGAEAAAEAYERELQRVFQLQPGAVPRFDLLLLGVGADGHIASLFPNTTALAVRDRLVIANSVPQLNTQRITLTVPVLLAARTIFILVSGQDKAEAVARAIEGNDDWTTTPAQLLRAAQGDVIWFLDRAAAQRLQKGQ
ncbi:6-phosphogluconolactonase [Thermorudis peleae]|uniref:6-phosphogluconolactonase n=1 Tax=Thermorudis peleae TaxID=1382356 RepID=UPI0005703C31|nr:6-phosphogluconolactonase [Thermorudis peleae]